MTSPQANKRKGAKAETDFLRWLLEREHQASRVRATGAKDEGDVHIHHGHGGIGNGIMDVVEVKSANRLELPAWMRERDLEVENARRYRPGMALHGFLVIRPKLVTNPAKWLAVRYCEEIW